MYKFVAQHRETINRMSGKVAGWAVSLPEKHLKNERH